MKQKEKCERSSQPRSLATKNSEIQGSNHWSEVSMIYAVSMPMMDSAPSEHFWQLKFTVKIKFLTAPDTSRKRLRVQTNKINPERLEVSAGAVTGGANKTCDQNNLGTHFNSWLLSTTAFKKRALHSRLRHCRPFQQQGSVFYFPLPYSVSRSALFVIKPMSYSRYLLAFTTVCCAVHKCVCMVNLKEKPDEAQTQ